MTQIDAIYTRQSVDRPDSISVESQAEICRREVVDNEFQIYTDKGYSGKNTDRPAVQELIKDIKAGKIKRVIVYRLDRISRSVLDFANLVDIFQKHKVDFVSTMEKFDTGTPIGKAMLMIIMIFAQLERETIQQRVIDAYKSRSKRGFYMGGRVPYGFELAETTLDGIRTKMYRAREDEEKIVRLIFSMYAKPHVSLGDVAKNLAEKGILKPDGKPFTRSRIRDIIVNPIYVRADYQVYDFFKKQGANVINQPEDFIGSNGAYYYSGKNTKRKSISLEGQTLVLAPHKGIVDSFLWLNCRKKCLSNAQVSKPIKAKSTWLAGKIKCGYCGYALNAKTYHCKTKEDNRYYLCAHKYQSGNCGFGSLDADAVDALIFAEIKKKIDELGPLQGYKNTGDNSEVISIRSKIERLDQEIESLMVKISSTSSTVMEYISKRIVSLDEEKKKLYDEIMLLQEEKANGLDNIENCMQFWDELSIDDKISVVDCLIVSISASKEVLEITWRI